MPQSIQVEKSIQYQSVPLEFLPGPGWMQATGQASTQSATPSQVFVTIVCDTVFLSGSRYQEAGAAKCNGVGARNQDCTVCSVTSTHLFPDTLRPPPDTHYYALLRLHGFNHRFSTRFYPGDISNAALLGIVVDFGGSASDQL
jgi:hypothetical protein